MVEDKLTLAFGQIWADLIERPDQNIDAILARHLEPLAQRLNMTLAQ
jgi:hypothetical protein